MFQRGVYGRPAGARELPLAKGSGFLGGGTSVSRGPLPSLPGPQLSGADPPVPEASGGTLLPGRPGGAPCIEFFPKRVQQPYLCP